MGKTSRKMYTPEFKAQMVIKALKEHEVLERAMQAHGAPEIINSGQGCQYASKSGWRPAYPMRSRSVWKAEHGVWTTSG